MQFIRSGVIWSWISVVIPKLYTDFGTKLWAMTVNWENLLTPGRKEKQLITCFKIHHLTGRKDAFLILHKLNVCPSYNDIRLQNKSWAGMVASESVLANTCWKSFQYTQRLIINDGMQAKLAWKGTTHNTKMTLFQPLCKGLRIFVDEILPQFK